MDKKPPKNIKNESSEGKSQLFWPPSIWVGKPWPIDSRGLANQKFGSDNDVWSQKLNFFAVKNPLQIQFENFSRVYLNMGTAGVLYEIFC